MADLGTYQFEADLMKFADLVDVTIVDVVRKISLDLFARIIGNFDSHRHPVDTGRARAGWGITIGTPEVPVPPPAPNGQANYYPPPAIPDLARVDGTVPVYILNSVPYIERLEDGWSKQAPNGMVRLSLMEVEAEIEALIKLNA